MDCPYYEQLQYAGDTRIQALVSLYMSGDDRLVRNAIAQLNDSRTPEGATYSRAPSRLQQYIPPFSLWWIGMVHDFWTYRDDPQFVREMLPGVRQVLTFFSRYQRRRRPFGRTGKSKTGGIGRSIFRARRAKLHRHRLGGRRRGCGRVCANLLQTCDERKVAG